MAPTSHNKTAFVAELVPNNRRFLEFSIQLVNSPGAVAEVASILSKHKVNILTGFHDPTQWSFFADVTEIESSTDDIVKEISSLVSVSQVSLSKEVSEGIVVDTLHQQLAWGPFRTIIVRAEVMRSILNRVKGVFGGDAGKTIVFGMGEAAGRNFFNGLISQINADVLKSHIDDIMGLYLADGWGNFRLITVDFSKTTACVRAQDSFECAPFLGSGSSPQGDFVAGHLTGVFSEIFGKRVQVTETSCIAHGGSYCQFDVKG